MPPAVSVILPTFNRSRFMPAAFEAIRAQHLTSWELIVFDDGSTDDTSVVVSSLSNSWAQPVTYVSQANGGAYAARNTGLRYARHDYIAFYDSDDLWLPHHLSTCVAALEEHPDIDWLYAACELVDLETQRVIRPNSFYTPSGGPRPFMRLAHETRGRIRVIATRAAIRGQIQHGLFCGLQNSVFRRRVFDRLRFATDLRNEAEDQLFAIRAAAAGFRLAYIDDVHVRYQVHAENSSGSARDVSLERFRRVFEPLVQGYTRLATEVVLTPAERRALRRRVGRELFWSLGYAGFWASGERRQALEVFARALHTWPWDPMQWKTYVLAHARNLLRNGAAC